MIYTIHAGDTQLVTQDKAVFDMMEVHLGRDHLAVTRLHEPEVSTTVYMLHNSMRVVEVPGEEKNEPWKGSVFEKKFIQDKIDNEGGK